MPRPDNDCCGSWPCQNALAGRTRRTLFFFGALSSTALASPLGNCGASRTRFPSVYALSAFLHGQGQRAAMDPTRPAMAGAPLVLTIADGLMRRQKLSESCHEQTL